ncbi:MAG TPA: bifunctional 5,10-methylenetetrahydrofolate dehydrogenase/5,10-methenyltetrahydrofolate cyclohydrolase [Clostridia bacterium]|nr:bifunctional 5,10-methylenetetrahydrofolate dehydrogenase/5,10-methenyltetrahydrofolate cyclohydrolase [Clostridia bacterium]
MKKKGDLMILKGKEVAKKIQESIAEVTQKEKIALAILAIGENKSADAYIKGVLRTSEKLGVEVKLMRLPMDISTERVINHIEKINNDDSINGLMIQMPLPKSLDQEKVINAIDYRKDIDSMTDKNLGMVLKGKSNGLMPCTPVAVLETLDYYDIDVTGLDVTVIGRSNIVGKPVAALLTNRGATVTICHSRTKKLKEKTKSADLVIVAVGKKDFLSKDMVSEKSVVIDVGINVENGKLYGDADYDALKNYVKDITPVPGGVGSITNTLLIRNTVKAFRLSRR